MLLFFVGLIALTMLVFGYSAYEIAWRSSTETESKVLDLVNHERSAELALEYGRHHAVESMAHRIHIDKGDMPLLMLLVDSGGKVHASSSTPHLAFLARSHKLVETALQSAHDTGKVTIGDQAYTFAAAEVPGSPYTLISISPRGYAARGALSRLASRLGVTGLMIAWVAVWISLVISTAVARRLRAQTDRLRYQATHDALTGLPNRAALLENLNLAIANAEPNGRSVALLLMDLDRFKEINDTLGHATGDLLIQKVADRLRVSLWEGDTIARLGGDEFGLILPMANSADTRLVVSKLRSILAEPSDVHGLSLRTDASIGIALYPEHAEDSGSLMRCAETAMYHAKSKRGGFEIYDASNDPFSIDQLRLTADVSRALAGGELFMVYQPKMDFGTGRCTGAEALLRWQHPERGFVPPDQFIPLAEQTSTIKDITFWTLDTAVAQCRKWHDAGNQIAVAVNLSATMLHDSTVPVRINGVLREHNVAPEFLQLEITETAIMIDPEGAFENLQALSHMGFHLSIDDFGTGYTSLSYLKRLPVDEIKIDKSFVMNMSENENDATIVSALIDLAHEMNLRVVAEGVETEDVLNLLAEKGCDQSQGYFHSRPLPPEELLEWLRRPSSPSADSAALA